MRQLHRSDIIGRRHYSSPGNLFVCIIPLVFCLVGIIFPLILWLHLELPASDTHSARLVRVERNNRAVSVHTLNGTQQNVSTIISARTPHASPPQVL